LLNEMRSISKWFDFRQKMMIQTGYEMKAPWGIRGLYNWNENQRLPILWWEKFLLRVKVYY